MLYQKLLQVATLIMIPLIGYGILGYPLALWCKENLVLLNQKRHFYHFNPLIMLTIPIPHSN